MNLKKIIAYYPTGEIHDYYSSIAEAADVLFVNRRSLHNALSRNTKTCAGFIWRYADEPAPAVSEEVASPDMLRKVLRVPVQDAAIAGEAPRFFSNIIEASRYTPNTQPISIAKAAKMRGVYKDYLWVDQDDELFPIFS